MTVAQPNLVRAGLWPLLLLLALGTMWGSTFSISKLAIAHGVPPLGYGVWQCLGAASLLFLVTLARGEPLVLNRASLRFGFLAGSMGITVPNLAFYFSIPHVPASAMAVVITVAPLFTLCGALGLGMERLSLLRTLGLLLGFSGTLVLLLPGAALPEGAQYGWLLLGLLTPLFYSINSLFAARARPPGQSPLSMAVLMLAGGAVVQVPVAVALDSLFIPSGFDLPSLMIMTQVTVSAVAYIIYFTLMRQVGPVYVGQVGYVVTLTGLVWAMLVFGERASEGLLAAVALILGGVYLVNRSSGATARPADR